MEKKNTVNLHLASIWDQLLKQGVDLLNEKVQKIANDKKIKTTLYNYFEKVDNEVVGFSWKTFVENDLGLMVMEGEFVDRFIKVYIAHWGPKKLGLFVFKGYTKEAFVIFGDRRPDKKKQSISEDVEEHWVSLEDFPSDEFCEICVKWIFEGVKPNPELIKSKTNTEA